MQKLLASSPSLDGIKQCIKDFFYGEKLLQQLTENEWLVLNLDGSVMGRPFRVVLKKGRYRFECYEQDNDNKAPAKSVLKLVENFHPNDRLCRTKKDFGEHTLWWVSPSGKPVETKTAVAAITEGLLVPCGDGLFEDGHSQSYKLAGA